MSILPSSNEPMPIPRKQTPQDPASQQTPAGPYNGKTQSEQMAQRSLADRMEKVTEQLNSEINKK